MTENGTVYARATDMYGNIGSEASVCVYNIDRNAPDAPSIVTANLPPMVMLR